MARMLGRPWLPYQRFIAQVAGELLEDGVRYAHHTVVIWMPRQTAKTTTAYDTMLGRGRRYPDFRCRYTTHQGTITSAKFRDEWFPELERSPQVAAQFRMRRSQGTEGVRWKRTRSYFQAFPPRDGALRSQALDAVVVDEAQEHDEILGAALRSTIRPTFTTRPRHQLWVVMSAGTDQSTYALDYLSAAMEGRPGYALFDYGCPDHIDPLDPALWPTWHPGLAYGLTTPEILRAALEEDEAAFVREYANRWTRTRRGSVIPTQLWEAVQVVTDGPRPAGRLCLSLAVTADRSSASIAAAGPDGWVELVERRPGVDWLAARALELGAAHGAPFAVDRYGAAGPIVDALERAGTDLLHMRSGDVANAAAGLVDAVTHGRIRVISSPTTPGLKMALDDSVSGAVQRYLADTGGFVWSLRGAASPADPIRAVSGALWGAAHLPPAPTKPAAHAM